MIQVYDIPSFTNLNNEESISSVSNVVSDKGAKIYKQLYNAALLSVIKEKFPAYNTIEEFKQDYIVIDSPQLDFNMPPTSTSKIVSLNLSIVVSSFPVGWQLHHIKCDATWKLKLQDYTSQSKSQL